MKQSTITFTIDFCKTKAAYTAKPTKQIKLHLQKIRSKYPLLIDTPMLLLIKVEDETEILVKEFGEIVFKTLKDKKKMEKIAEEIYNIAA